MPRLPGLAFALLSFALPAAGQAPSPLPGQRVPEQPGFRHTPGPEEHAVVPTERPEAAPGAIQLNQERGNAIRPLVTERPGEKVAAARENERIWSALILASQSDHPHAPPPELGKMAKKIEQFFGYDQVDLVGSASKEIDDNFEQWLVPSTDFWLAVKSKKEPNGVYLLTLQIFHDKRHILQTEVRLTPNSPLLIRGPLCAKGQLVIALQVQP